MGDKAPTAEECFVLRLPEVYTIQASKISHDSYIACQREAGMLRESMARGDAKCSISMRGSPTFCIHLDHMACITFSSPVDLITPIISSSPFRPHRFHSFHLSPLDHHCSPLKHGLLGCCPRSLGPYFSQWIGAECGQARVVICGSQLNGQVTHQNISLE